MVDYSPFMATDYRKLTPEQIKRQREFAYALMKGPQTSRSWAQPIGDVLNIIAGQHMLQQTGNADYDTREAAGQKTASTLRDSRSLLQNIQPQQQSNNIIQPKTDITNTGSISPDDGSLIESENNQIEAPKTGFKLDEYLKGLAQIESSGGKNRGPNQYGYGGPFGFRRGESGLNDDNWGDDTAHIKAAVDRTLENTKAFKEQFNREPTNEELYLMHNQGAAGGLAHMLSGERPAWQNARDASGTSERVAKLRIKEQISDSSLKKRSDNITSEEFQKYLSDKFSGGWKGATKTLPGQIGGGAVGEDTETVRKAVEGQRTSQAIPGVPAPTPLRHPAPNLNEKELGSFFADPRIDQSTKDKVYDQINKAATPIEDQVVGGIRQTRPGEPNQSVTKPVEHYFPTSLGDIHTQGRTITDPNTGGSKTEILVPGKGWTSWDEAAEYNRQKKAQDVRVTGEATGDTQQYNDEFHSIQDMATRSQNQIPMIQKMRALAQDPRFYSGSGDERVLDIKKLLHATGINPGTTSPNEVFNKIVAGTTIGELSQFDKHGRVLATEFDQLKRSLANSNVTQPAIMDLLDMSEKLHNKAVRIGEEASNYADKTAHGGLDKGWAKHLREFNKKNSVPSKEDLEKPAGSSKSEKKSKTDDSEWIDLGNGIKKKR